MLSGLAKTLQPSVLGSKNGALIAPPEVLALGKKRKDKNMYSAESKTTIIYGIRLFSTLFYTELPHLRSDACVCVKLTTCPYYIHVSSKTGDNGRMRFLAAHSDRCGVLRCSLKDFIFDSLGTCRWQHNLRG